MDEKGCSRPPIVWRDGETEKVDEEKTKSFRSILSDRLRFCIDQHSMYVHTTNSHYRGTRNNRLNKYRSKNPVQYIGFIYHDCFKNVIKTKCQVFWHSGWQTNKLPFLPYSNTLLLYLDFLLSLPVPILPIQPQKRTAGKEEVVITNTTLVFNNDLNLERHRSISLLYFPLPHRAK